jgi:hypothetical protein
MLDDDDELEDVFSSDSLDEELEEKQHKQSIAR